MLCPFCNTINSVVKDSRYTHDNKVVRRRRACSHCNGRFTTFERVESHNLVVIKRTGIKRRLDRMKILKSIAAALRKRSVSSDIIEKLTDSIILKLESSAKKEVKSYTIGKIIMKKLADIDQVAYVRFASVYKDFSTVDDFVRFIGKMKN